MAKGLRVGAASVDITPAPGAAMGGYGARQGVALGVAGALRAHVIAFDDGTTQLALVTCDLLYVTWDLSALTRRLVADMLGWRPEQLLLNATHTHSGPFGLTLDQDATYVTTTARRVAATVQLALNRRRPATLKYTETSVSSVSRNRREPDGPIESVARILVAEADDGAPGREVLATVVNYACHATVLEYDNLEYSPDFPGAAVDVIERTVGGAAAYLQGCAGDINPVWTAHDHVEARRVGSILGAAVARAVHEVRGLGRGQSVVNLSQIADLPADVAFGRQLADIDLRVASVRVPLPLRTPPRAAQLEPELAAVITQLTEPSTEARLEPALLARRAELEAALHFCRHPLAYHVRIAPAPGPGDTDGVEIQVLRFDEKTALIGLPGEPFVGIAEEIRRRSDRCDLLIAGYCNEDVGYVPGASDFPHAGYEIGAARYQPEAAELLIEAAVHELVAVG